MLAGAYYLVGEDARNVMYRAIYAVRSERGRHRSPVVVMLRMLAPLLHKYDPSMVQVFWDAPRHTVWRRAVLSCYKDRPSNHGGRDISSRLVTRWKQNGPRGVCYLTRYYQFHFS